jgi:hypothetical protein
MAKCAFRQGVRGFTIVEAVVTILLVSCTAIGVMRMVTMYSLIQSQDQATLSVNSELDRLCGIIQNDQTSGGLPNLTPALVTQYSASLTYLSYPMDTAAGTNLGASGVQWINLTISYNVSINNHTVPQTLTRTILYY